MQQKQRQQITIPLSLAMTVIGTIAASIFSIGFWCATISFRLDAVAAEASKVAAQDNRLTRIETILEIQFPNAAFTAKQKFPESKP